MSTHANTADYPRSKRGRYSDPGPRGREPETTAEQKLESLITRVGEKVCGIAPAGCFNY